MAAASYLLRWIFAGAVSLGLIVSGVCLPLATSACELAKSDVRSQSCCCGEDCHCGAACGQASRTNDRQQSTATQHDHRDLGKINGHSALPTGHSTAAVRVAVVTTLSADLYWSPTLLDQHTCLRV